MMALEAPAMDVNINPQFGMECVTPMSPSAQPLFGDSTSDPFGMDGPTFPPAHSVQGDDGEYSSPFTGGGAVQMSPLFQDAASPKGTASAFGQG